MSAFSYKEYENTYHAVTTAPWRDYYTSIINVIIEEGVTSIGTCSFRGCSSIISVSLPSSITEIGSQSFFECSKLKNINIPVGCLKIGSEAFCVCSELSSVSIPDSVNNIGWGAFSRCGVSTVRLSNNITEIFKSTFFGCTNLEKITIPNNVGTIHEDAFRGCTNLTRAILGSGLKYIYDQVFEDCVKLSNVTLPSLLEYIGQAAFFNCNSLISINIPKNVSTIKKGAFNACDNLSQISVDNENTVFTEKSSCIIKISTGELVVACNSSSIPDDNSVKSIGDYSFRLCKGIENVVIPDGVISIGNLAFNQCSSLKTLTLSNSVRTIKDNAFYGCSNLADVYYSGSKAEWDSISIGQNNESLTNATIHFLKIATYTIIYDSNGGINTPESQVKVYEEPIVLTSSIPTREGYTFKHWNTISDDSGTAYNPGDNYAEDVSVTLYAIWEQIIITPVYYTLTYNGNGAVNCPDSQTGNGIIYLSDIIPQKDNYTFIGWVVSTNSFIKYQPGAAFDLKENTVLVAVWKKNECRHSNQSTKIINNIEPTCEDDGYYEIVTFCTDCTVELNKTSVYVPKLGHSFTNYIYNNDATTESDGTETAKCDRCDITDTKIKHGTKIPSNPDNPYENVSNCSIDASSGNITINWKFKAHLWANAYNLPSDCHLAWFENNTMVSNNSEYTTDNLTSAHTYTIKIVDSSNQIVSKPEQEKTVTINVKNDFFSKIVSFFTRLFGSDVITI